MLTSEIKVIQYHNQKMDVHLNDITIKVYIYKSPECLQISCLFPIFQVLLSLYVLTSEVAVVKSHHGISLKCSRCQDTGPTDPSLSRTAHFRQGVLCQAGVLNC